MIRVALVGNPNSGKTTLFNTLTGASARVGNWPGVTIDKKTGIYRKLDENIEIIDLPGLYSLNSYTEEEKIARDFILEGQIDAIINIVDATNLERNLYLTTQLLEVDIPLVVALNFFDVVEKDHISIDPLKLSSLLTIPVVPISALKNHSIKDLLSQVLTVAHQPRVGHSLLLTSALGPLIEEAKNEVNATALKHNYYFATKLIEGNVEKKLFKKDSLKRIEAFKKALPEDIFRYDYAGKIADFRYQYIGSIIPLIVVAKVKTLSRARKIDKILTHKKFGIPLFALIMFFVFHLTFSEDLFFLGAIGLIAPTLDLGIIGVGAISSPGVILANLMGLLIDGVNLFLINVTSGQTAWVSSLFVDGIWAGVGAVLSFLPQILTLYIFISILEDTGYMSRVAFMLDRLTRRFGLSGRAFLPLLMSFGCAVPGIMATRTLRNEKEKRLTILLSPFFSCGAKLPIWLVFGAILFGGRYADLVVTSIYLLGIVVAIITGYITNRFFIKSQASPFVMEMPDYRLPKWLNVGQRSLEKVKDYLLNAATIIAASTIIIWFLTSFSFSFEMVTDTKTSIIGVLAGLIAPLFIPLGFGQGPHGWMFIVASFTGLIAKEMIPSTLATIAQVSGDVLTMGGSELLSSPLATLINTLSPGAAFAFMAFNLLTIPCMAAVGAARAELKSKKDFFLTILLWILISFFSGVIVYLSIDFLIARIIVLSIFSLFICYLIIEKVIKHRRKRI